MYRIRFTPEAYEDLLRYRKFERRRLIAEIESQLSHQPLVETRNRKRLRPNRLAEWELRIGNNRIFYDVDKSSKNVKILAIGRNVHNILIIHDKEFEL